jgi:hypothetical protein
LKSGPDGLFLKALFLETHYFQDERYGMTEKCRKTLNSVLVVCAKGMA